ncbi:hypothetical protein ANPL_03300 [Anaplasma platys]|uniref:Rod shape-determining protein MreD n=1 Tax=Anaplasma platys TaxID=949 RepID=A0A858PYU3_9RICK|nr:hypothetical protein [Anaplasma platys]QJC27718.1 hypothetical protein ANPL_03300 [Anaplasma platys]
MEELLWRGQHRWNEPGETTLLGDLGIFFALAALVTLEFLANGVTRGFIPRLDIVLLLFLHSRGRVPGCMALFSVGLFRDFLFFASVGASSVFYILSNIIVLRRYGDLENRLGLLVTVILVYLVQLVTSLVFGGDHPVFYLLQQIPLSYVLCLLLVRRG